MVLLSEAHGVAGYLHCTGISGHHDYDVTKISFAPVIIGQGAMIHYLQQKIEYIWVCFLDLI